MFIYLISTSLFLHASHTHVYIHLYSQPHVFTLSKNNSAQETYCVWFECININLREMFYLFVLIISLSNIVSLYPHPPATDLF